eukprot:CAMPEP_0184478954 /NCGR_PEP_ID=MMETSP0113_2-20130426/837_1 /TAXON_ID=91329 /ORGANISM="Norrisiella sphaerica, Strain BC52" /LENGTH=493 /DNA_ID=CAMNT_0026856909 /DNA_START=26 /DNA_END=1507 /DNA_ORIENTATION=-
MDAKSKNEGEVIRLRRSATEFDPEEFAVKMIGFYPDTSPLIKPLPTVKSVPTLRGYDSFGDDKADSDDDDIFSHICSFREGSIRASVFNLCSATLGAGALSLPYAFRFSGLINGILLLFLGGAATLFSIYLLIKARDITGARSYEDLTVQLFGQNMGIAMEMCVIIFCFGCAVAYIIAVGDILQLAHIHWIMEYIGRRGVMCTFFFAVMLPLSLVDSVNDLRFTSFLGVISIFYLVLAACFHAGVDIHRTGWHAKLSDIEFLSTDAAGALAAFPVMIFAYTCQTNVFSVYYELAKPSASRMQKVSWRSVAICFFIYLSMGVAGYLEYGHHTRPNIIQNYINSEVIHMKAAHMPVSDILIIMASVGVVLTVTMAFPLVIFPCRFTIGVLVFKIEDGKMKRWLHVAVTVILCVSALLVSLFVPNISTVFALMGSTASSFVCFVLPAILSLKLIYTGRMKFPTNIQFGLILTLAIGGSLLGIASTIVTLLSYVRQG